MEITSSTPVATQLNVRAVDFKTADSQQNITQPERGLAPQRERQDRVQISEQAQTLANKESVETSVQEAAEAVVTQLREGEVTLAAANTQRENLSSDDQKNNEKRSQQAVASSSQQQVQARVGLDLLA
ncbi:MAG: hypothetical protein R8M38_02080 [Mariprofundaceae bacterium]